MNAEEQQPVEATNLESPGPEKGDFFAKGERRYEILSRNGGSVVLRGANGAVITEPIGKLIANGYRHIAQQNQPAPPRP
ncbi:MAG: hypothetical protein LC114_06555 [Bryobacterales bacterium]|jgi:hypothetical protein|nr:hypothetical protein [Bryobacterales bacterium]